MLLRAAYFCAALAVALNGSPLGTPASALADSGGYRRPDISAQYGLSTRPAGPHRPAVAIGVQRPEAATSPSSAGDIAISRSTATQALRQYRASQQPRRPSVESTARSDTAWGSGGYTVRRPPSYAAPAAVIGGSGGYGTAAFWAMLGALSASDRTAYFRQSQADPGYQQWRQQVTRDPPTAARLAALGDSASAAPGDVGATTAIAPGGSSGGSSIVWVVLFVAVAAFALLWLARRRAAQQPTISSAPGITGSTTTRFRVGQTIPLDPAPFLLAVGVTKVQPPPGSGMISIEAVGLLEDAGVQLHRLYLPGRASFFQLHLGADGAPDECRYFSRLDEVQPADQSEWGQWLGSGTRDDRLAGIPDQGWPDLRPRMGTRAE